MTAKNRSVALAILVAALGYFVDVYDLILFSVVRQASLQDLAIKGEDLLPTGVFLLNMQMTGMLVGGVLWGVWGDKRGRVSVLFGSIFLYSAANIANGFVQAVPSYALCRLIAGIGLAGELGAGITLVSESMSARGRGYGTTLVATMGVFGGVVAALVGDLAHWRSAYFIGGGLGILLLLMRILVHESGLFQLICTQSVERGNLLMLFQNRERFFRYLRCILIGVPIWAVVGIVITFSPELGKALGMAEPPNAGKAVMFAYIGLVIGDLVSGLLSQWLKSRKKAMLVFLVLTFATSIFTLSLHGIGRTSFYALCVPLGFAVGYWAVFVSTAAEQFGTNLRATVTTTAPNFVRGSVVPLTSLFKLFNPYTGIRLSAAIVVTLAIVVALLSLSRLQESYGKELDFLEV